VEIIRDRRYGFTCITPLCYNLDRYVYLYITAENGHPPAKYL
jgi:hypothetical protein